MGRGTGTAYAVTCEVCGQTWQRSKAEDNESLECLFCGVQGHLELGLHQPEEGGQQGIEAWLRAKGR